MESDTERLREWLAAVLPVRTAHALVELGADPIVTEPSGVVRVPIVLAVLEGGAITSFSEELLGLVYAIDLETPRRTQAYLRAWRRVLEARIGNAEVTYLTPHELAPYASVLEDLANETEDDFVAALDDRTHWDSRPDTPPRILDLADLGGSAPIARSEAHEAAIVASGFADAAFDDYARWLASKDDPRGQVVLLEIDGSQGALRRAQHLVATHPRYFFGPLPGTAQQRFVWGPTIEIELARGWIDTVRVDLADAVGYSGLDPVALLRALFELPGARFLRRLDLAQDDPDEDADERVAPVAALEAAGGHPNLRELVVASAPSDEPTLRRLFPRLERIVAAEIPDDDE